ncbi:MAG: alpha/beta hydrolase [Bacteroidota bacterium]
MKELISLTLLSILSTTLLSQTPSQAQLTEHVDIPYVDETSAERDTLRRLNLVLPSGDVNTPLLIWIGGGAWSYVDKDQEMDLCRQFAHQGIAVASIGQRLSPATWKDPSLAVGIQHPKHAEDVAAAIRWLYDHAGQYGYDEEKLFIGGYSSGGHLSALLGLDNDYLSEVGLSTKVFKGLICVSGTNDIIDYYNTMANGRRPELAQLHVEAVFGAGTKVFKEASPVSYLANLSAPVLLMSDGDLLNYSSLFEDSIRSAGFEDLDVVYTHHLSHAELWRSLSHEDDSPYRQFITRFIQIHS